MPMQVNITTKVNSQSIRRETYNGREHLVLPSYTLPANVVMNGGLYTQEEIDAHYQGLEGTRRRWDIRRLTVSLYLPSHRRVSMPAISVRGTAMLRSPVTVSISKSGSMWHALASRKAVKNCLSVSRLSSAVKTSHPFTPVWRHSSTSLNQMSSSAQQALIGWQNPQHGP